MAVTKIHKTSRIALYVTVVISLVVIALFAFGGQVPAEQKIAADLSQPKFTDIMLYWVYILLGVTVAVLLIFALFEFITSFRLRPKKALASLAVVLMLAVILIVSYFVGDGALLNIPGYDGADNNPITLKITDMWIYSIYVMLGLTVLFILISPVFKKIKK